MGNKMIVKKYATHRREPFFEIANKYISEDSIVLDIGAGRGDFAAYCGRNDFYLIDGNIESVSFLKELNRNVFYGRLPKLPFGDDFFDVIHCSHVVEHLQPEELYITLSEIDRCLKKNGVLVISAPLYWDGFFNDLSHIKPYNPDVFTNYLCSKVEESRSRKIISNNFQKEELIFRYIESNPLEGIVNSSKNYFVKLFLKTLSLLRRLGLKFYSKTGYTIVLKKS